MLEIWRTGGAADVMSADSAVAVEMEGWDGQTFADSQSLTWDPYVVMGAWAQATKRIKLSTGVTNPLTRHPAVTASSIATVHALSGGRAVLGIGRGDSALAYLGMAPIGPSAFEQAMVDLRALLSGEAIPFGRRSSHADAPSSAELSLSDRPSRSRLAWLPRDLPRVPLDVAATGPKVIAAAARIAEQVTFSVGAIGERLDWALDVSRSAQGQRPCTLPPLSHGAQLIVVCHDDEDAACDFAAGFVAPLARFQVIQGSAVGPQSDGDRENFETIRTGYAMTKHGATDAKEKLGGASLTREFIRRFAIVGSPDYCTRRLVEIAELGIDRLILVGPASYPPEWGEAPALLAREVLPAVRKALSG